ncbi:unnamed protein product [Urochloa humidicola]
MTWHETVLLVKGLMLHHCVEHRVVIKSVQVPSVSIALFFNPVKHASLISLALSFLELVTTKMIVKIIVAD